MATKPFTWTTIHGDIYEAYLSLSTKSNDWVPLRNLRPLVEQQFGHSQDAIAAALLEMGAAEEAQLVPDSNRKVLTEADHANALRYGRSDDARHLVAIWED